MRAVIQLVSQATVSVEGQMVAAIGPGLLTVLGVGAQDREPDADYLADKIAGLRIFPDQHGQMNLSLADTGGQLLVVSQFTLYGDCRKGRRPSFSQAAPPEAAKRLYLYFIERLRGQGIPTACGVFQAEMSVALVNQGPITIILDSAQAHMHT